MKRSIFRVLLLSLVFPLFLVSCTDHDEEPEPEEPTTSFAIQQNIVGKYTTGNATGKISAEAGFIEFLTDSTYIIYNITDTLLIGKYEATSEKDIVLNNYGTISEIMLSSDNLNFKLSYSGKTLTVVTKKAPSVTGNSKTVLLARNWSVTEEEDGSKLLTSDGDPNVKFNIQILFSPSGTYLYQYLYQGQLFNWGLANWKWHSSNPNQITFWKDGEEIKENENVITIRDLSKDILKITDNGNNLVLMPEK